MTPDPAKLLQEVLKLPPADRAALAAALLDSLEESVDEGREALWAIEIARRLQDLDSRRVQPLPWAEARRQICGR
jgi:putative addiction module component (TIGR02574 family)